MKIRKGISTAYGPGRFCGLGHSQFYQKRCRAFVAKVLRLSEDKKTAYLADFEEEEPGRFKSTAEKIW